MQSPTKTAVANEDVKCLSKTAAVTTKDRHQRPKNADIADCGLCRPWLFQTDQRLHSDQLRKLDSCQEYNSLAETAR